jgi:diacylglycerol kinase family enzyme
MSFVKRRWVDGAIMVTALRTFVDYRNFPIRISLDGAEPRELQLTNLGVVKNVHFSGQMRYDQPQASDDGLFGVHLAERLSRGEMLRTLNALGSGRFTGLPKTSSYQATRVALEADKPFALETDGEVIRARAAELTVLPRELLVCP